MGKGVFSFYFDSIREILNFLSIIIKRRFFFRYRECVFDYWYFWKILFLYRSGKNCVVFFVILYKWKYRKNLVELKDFRNIRGNIDFKDYKYKLKCGLIVNCLR